MDDSLIPLDPDNAPSALEHAHDQQQVPATIPWLAEGDVDEMSSNAAGGIDEVSSVSCIREFN